MDTLCTTGDVAELNPPPTPDFETSLRSLLYRRLGRSRTVSRCFDAIHALIMEQGGYGVTLNGLQVVPWIALHTTSISQDLMGWISPKDHRSQAARHIGLLTKLIKASLEQGEMTAPSRMLMAAGLSAAASPYVWDTAPTISRSPFQKACRRSMLLVDSLDLVEEITQLNASVLDQKLRARVGRTLFLGLSGICHPNEKAWECVLALAPLLGSDPHALTDDGDRLILRFGPPSPTFWGRLPPDALHQQIIAGFLNEVMASPGQGAENNKDLIAFIDGMIQWQVSHHHINMQPIADTLSQCQAVEAHNSPLHAAIQSAYLQQEHPGQSCLGLPSYRRM